MNSHIPFVCVCVCVCGGYIVRWTRGCIFGEGTLWICGCTVENEFFGVWVVEALSMAIVLLFFEVGLSFGLGVSVAHLGVCHL